MNCDVCQRSHDAKKLPFYCAVDARNRLYESRIDIVNALTRNEEIERKVNAALASQGEEGQDGESFEPSVRMDWLKSEESSALDTASRVIAQAGRLKADIEAARKEIEQKKERIARRKSELSSTSVGSSQRKSRHLDEAQRSMSRLRYKWNNVADTMAGTRAFLCEEAARLYGLRQVKKGSTRRYEIGGVEIVELHAMNSASPEVISTSLAHVSHILVLASHYLAIRLPAEITLPHRDYPRPTILTLLSSYKHENIPFPGSAQMQIISAGEGEPHYTPRPRPLYIDKPLPTLAKEDPQSYALFLEGVSLLAYNVAWACCSQGVSIGDKDSYEDICNMGQNLWRLLIGDQLHRQSVEPKFPMPLLQASGSGSPKNDGNGEMTRSKSLLGRWSHGTMFAFLGSAEGSEFVRGFKILSPTKLVDKLKKRLSSEAPMLEWETIEGDELDDGYDGQGLTAGGRAGAGAAHDNLGVESIMTVRTTAGTNSTWSNNNSSKGTSGWTKLKSRYGDK
ncbi:UV radiation resistance protein and autophagy-related subunit 14 domain containing protein [Rhypophila decipiens]